MHHLERMLPGENNCVILTGYQAIGTRGRSLLDGATSVKMHGMEVAVRCRVVRDEEFSVHADASELLDWVGALKPAPRQVFCVHGEDDSTKALAKLLGEKLSLAAIPARANQSIDVRATISKANLRA